MITVWTLWGLFFIVSFALLEGFALKTNRTTLSRYVWIASKAWPPLPFIVGFVVGFLACHFWWGGIVHFDAVTPAGAAERSLILPDPALTPGVATDLTAHQTCHKEGGWGRDARHVTATMKREVFERYGLTGNTDQACLRDKHGRRCEIDHLISRELGGADDVDNLWPQPYGGQPWNAVRKDKVENRLHKEVCAGNITLDQAQHDILDYRVPYRRYFGEPE